MLKFVHDERVYIVKGQEKWMVASLSGSSPIDASSERIESSFQSFEITGASYVKEGLGFPKPQIAKVMKKVVKFMLEKGFCPGEGLGKNQQGIKKPVEMINYPER